MTVFYLLLALVAIALLLFLFYASYSIEAGVYLKSLCKIETKTAVIALSFDDGPHPIYTPQVLDVLQKHQVKAIFFCIGSEAEKHPEIMARIHNEGHLVGNHSYSHSWHFPLLKQREIEADILLAEQCIAPYQRIGKLFRPPFGVTNPRIARAVKRIGLRSIGWSIRSFDTKQAPTEQTLKRIKKRIKPGAILLLHDRMPETARLVEELLAHLEKIQYKLVSLDEYIQ